MEGVLLLLMYMKMHVLTLRCGFCKSRKKYTSQACETIQCKTNAKMLVWLFTFSFLLCVISLCTVTKEEEKTRNVNVYLLINSIACNELTTACRVWYLNSLKACTLFISYWLICQETRNEVEVNAPRLSVLGLFGFRKMTYTPRWRE